MIRPFGLRDILAIRQLASLGVAFDLRRALLYGRSPAFSAVFGYLTRHYLGPMTCIEQTDRQVSGFCQVWPRSQRTTWEIGFLAPSIEYRDTSTNTWHQLLTNAIRVAVENQVQRVYARVPEDPEMESVLRKAGFTVVTHEEIFALASPSQPAPRPRGLKPVARGDEWYLRELYRQAMPPLIKQSEGPIPDWYSPSKRVLTRFSRTREMIWIEQGRANAYFSLCSSANGYWLEMVVRPECRGDALPYIKHLLSLADGAPNRPIYCPIPDYAVGLGLMLQTQKFQSYTRQVLFVAHTVARVPVSRPLVMPALDNTIDIGSPVGRASTTVQNSERG